MKKILSVLLTTAMISFMWSTLPVEAENSENYEYYAVCLDALGGIDYTGEEDMNRIVSREEFCEIAVRFMGYAEAEVGEDAKTPFIDVPPSRQSYKAVRTMYDLGYISGDGSKHYYPEDGITVAGAATIAAGMLGYSYEAATLGGYPHGYISLAYDKKILSERFESYHTPMTIGNVYRMLYDMLEVPIMEMKIQGAGAAYTAENKKTILGSRFQTEKYEGLVTANQYTGLTSVSDAAGKGNISVDGKVYLADGNYNDMLGMQTEYYVSYKNDSGGEIVYMHPDKNTVTTVNSCDIEEITSEKLTYTEEDKRIKSVKISAGADVIYNGTAYVGYGVLADLDLRNGTVILIDNNRDGKADVMNITEYQNYYIDGINKSDRIIYDYEKARQLEMKSVDSTVEIFQPDGSAARFSDLKKGTLVSVAKGLNEGDKLIRVYICENTVEGKVEMVSEDEYQISGNLYKAAPDLATAVSMKTEGIFFLDITGKIAAVKTQNNDAYKYAVVYNRWYDENAETTGLKLFTEEEKFVEYTLNEKINVNGKKVKAHTKAGSESLINDLPKGIVIRYRISEDGAGISHIEIPLAMREDRNGNRYPEDSDEFRTLFEGSSFKYRNGMFDGKVIANENTVIFSIPKSESWSDKNLFGTLKTNSFSGGTSYSKNFKAYVIGENPVNRADVMTVEDMVRGSIGNGTNLVLVHKINIGINPSGDACRVIKGINGGNAVEYYCSDDSLIDQYGVSAGDVIRIGVNSVGEVNKIQKIYNADGSSANGALLVPSEGVSENTASFDSEFRVAVGQVQDIDSGYMRFNLVKKSGEELYEESSICRTEGASVIAYDSDGNRNNIPAPCSVNDILRGDTVVIRMNLAAAKEIIILR